MDRVEAPIDSPVDKNGWTMKPPISDQEVILRCLQNAPEGIDREQLRELVKKYEPP